MRPRFISTDPHGTLLYDAQGNPRATFNDLTAATTSPHVDLGPADPGRIQTGGHQMNPVGALIPSTVVSPQATWVPVLAETSLVINLILEIVRALNDIDDSLEPSQNPTHNKVQKFEVINMESMIPVSVLGINEPVRA